MRAIGLVLPAGSPSDRSGPEARAGAEAAVRLAGDEVHLVVREATTPDDAERAAAALIDEEGVEIIVGTIYTALAGRAATATRVRDRLFWELAAVADWLTVPGSVARSGPRAAAYGEVAAQLLAALGHPAQVVNLAEASSFGQTLGAAIEAATGRPVIPAAPDGSDLPTILDALVRDPPEVLLAACYTPLAQALWRSLLEARPAIGHLVGVGGGWLHLERGPGGLPGDRVLVIDTMPGRLLNPMGLLPSTRQQLRRAGRAIQERTRAPSTVYADLAFAGVDLLIRDVLPAAADASPAALEAALALVDRPAGGTILGYGARFDRGENLRAAPVVSQWRSGALVVVWPPSLATAALDQGSPLAR